MLSLFLHEDCMKDRAARDTTVFLVCPVGRLLLNCKPSINPSVVLYTQRYHGQNHASVGSRSELTLISKNASTYNRITQIIRSLVHNTSPWELPEKRNTAPTRICNGKHTVLLNTCSRAKLPRSFNPYFEIVPWPSFIALR